MSLLYFVPNTWKRNLRNFGVGSTHSSTVMRELAVAVSVPTVNARSRCATSPSCAKTALSPEVNCSPFHPSPLQLPLESPPVHSWVLKECVIMSAPESETEST